MSSMRHLAALSISSSVPLGCVSDSAVDGWPEPAEVVISTESLPISIALRLTADSKLMCTPCEKAERGENTGEEQKGQGTWDEGQDQRPELSHDVWLRCGLI